ncbi:eomesodermin homolog b [Polymixia lowei]
MLGGEGDSSTFPSPKDATDERRKSPSIEGDDSSASRYTEHGIATDRYYVPPSSAKQRQEATNPCSFTPYTGQAGTVYTSSSAARYSTSLHFGSVLPPTGFSGRSQFSSAYQFDRGPGCIYPTYPGSGSGISTMPLPTTGPGVRAQVYLCNRPLWLKFHRHQTEMIITKQGRRMFPFLSFNIAGLNLAAHYNVFVEVVLADPNHWRFQGGKWVTCGKADNNMQGNKVYIHPESPNTGAHWMRQEISFGKLKLTNNKGTNNSSSQMIVLQSLHKYQPRLHIVEVTEDGVEDMNSNVKTQTFTFPETQFIAVTAYQNTDITQLKIDHNPFAKGFRDNYDSMYTAPESDRLTPSPTDSPRSHQIVPGARYAMQPLFQDQFVNNLPQNRLYNSERAVPQTSGLLSPPTEDAASQRWFVASMQQGGSGSGSTNKLELTPYDGDYSSTLLPYGIKSLSMQTSHALGYYPDSPFTTMAAGWGSRGTYQRKVTPSLPWSPRPSPTTGFPEDSDKDKPQAEQEISSGGLISAWTDTQPSALTVDKVDHGAYSTACKRRRLSLSGPSTENSPIDIKCEDLAPAATNTSSYSKETLSKAMASYYSFYTSP